MRPPAKCHPDKLHHAHGKCDACYKVWQRDVDPGKYRRATWRKSHFRRAYGISPEEYDRLLEEQGGVCAICGSVNVAGRRLGVDHDHDTGRVRGLLCNKCNQAIGLVPKIPTLVRAIEYLRAALS